jgi:protein required for attachment to host cells
MAAARAKASPARQPSPPTSALVRKSSKENEMQVPHNTFVVVADGKKMLFFRNEGDAEFPSWRWSASASRSNLADREMKTDEARPHLRRFGRRRAQRL